ncbi:MAG: hypothetical protein HYU30_10265 [Chloroflexi bacterium]|nr:hypothetical protein [Chloroflexota bacterium]MBI4197986.1 hypothetical protein [Chloroflexota bacterium]
MRWTLIALGVLSSLTGIIWVLQGLDILGGSFMSGNSMWGWIGAVALVIGLGLLYLGLRTGMPKAKV